jgi:hypothetical protein
MRNRLNDFEANPPQTVATDFEAKQIEIVAIGFEVKPRKTI